MAGQKKNKEKRKNEVTTETECVQFATGAVRSSVKPRYDLIPRIALERIAQRFTGEVIDGIATGGAFKYGETNWEIGLPTSDTINHIIEHITNYMDAFRESHKKNGNDIPGMQKVVSDMRRHSAIDDDLAGAIFGLIVLMYQEQSMKMYRDERFKVSTGVSDG